MIRLDDEGSPTQRKAGAGACTQHKTHPVKTPQQDPTERLCMLRAVPAKGGVKEEGDKTSRSSHTGHDHTGKQQAAPSRPERAPAQTRHKRPEEVFPQESRRVATELSRPDKPAHSNSRLWQQQIFHVVPPMFPGRRSPGSGSRSEKQGEHVA